MNTHARSVAPVDVRAATWRLAADLTTVAVLAVGLVALALRADPPLALAAFALAAVLDGLDGALARRAGGPTAHGALLDALADLTAFGLAPAALVLAPNPAAADTIAAAMYLVAGAARLSRGLRPSRAPGSRGYAGLPMPAAGALVLGLALGLGAPVWLAAPLVAGLALGRRRYPTVPDLWSGARPAVLAVAALAAAAATRSPSAALLVVAGAYAAWPAGRVRAAPL